MGFKAQMPFNVAMVLLTATESNVQGVTKKTYQAVKDGKSFFGSFRTFGGTESRSDDVVTLIDTAIINCWYDPDIKAECAVYICETGQTYDIIGTPEDIEMRHQYMQFKVRKAGGKP